MKLWRTFVLAAVMAALAGAPGTTFAYGDGTPDEQPPAEEPPCDAAGIRGAAYGLCIAFCEANDCEVLYDHSCDVLRANYAKMTGEDVFPCEVGGPNGPGLE
jgi:hypothetical protein